MKTSERPNVYFTRPKLKNTIRDGSSTALYAVYTVDTADMVYTVDTIDAVYTVYTIHEYSSFCT